MKIETKHLSYDEVMALPLPKHVTPKKPSLFFRTLMRIVGAQDLKDTHFTYTFHDMEKAGKGPYLILMNHCSFIDLSMAAEIFAKLPYCIICTHDAYVGKAWLMRQLGCFPTKKFVSDVNLIGDMQYVLRDLKTSILMYPEAGYSLDGTGTVLPKKMGVLLKRLGVPVVSVHTNGAFTRDPLYNDLQKRKVTTSAEISCLFSAEEVKKLSVAELDQKVEETFTFDYFTWQKENNIRIDEPFRADGLNRILYRCASCEEEGQMEGKGITLTCRHCGKTYTLNELGQLEATDGNTEFSHIPSWFAWQRDKLKKSIEDGTYRLDTDVEIGIIRDYKALYMVGEGHLTQTCDGFTLTGCDGKLNYSQGPTASYTLNSDYFWYEMGDIISFGNQEVLYYCFPKQRDVVAKARQATEEIYKLKSKKRLVKEQDA